MFILFPFQRRRYLRTWNGKLVWATCHLHSSAQSQVPVDKRNSSTPLSLMRKQAAVDLCLFATLFVISCNSTKWLKTTPFYWEGWWKPSPAPFDVKKVPILSDKLPIFRLGLKQKGVKGCFLFFFSIWYSRSKSQITLHILLYLTSSYLHRI